MQRGFALPQEHADRFTNILLAKNYFSFDSWQSSASSYRSLRKFDGMVSRISAGAEFHAYLPHSYYHIEYFLASHTMCRGFSYIEEGLTSYYKFSEIDLAYPPRMPSKRHCQVGKFLLRGRLPDSWRFFLADYQHAYGLSHLSFPQWQRRIGLNLPFKRGQPVMGPDETLPILVFDALVEIGMAPLEALSACLDDFLLLSRQNFPRFRYKFHPSQDEIKTKAVLRRIIDSAGGVVAEELAAEDCLEEIAAESGCDFFIFNSASGLYAALLGCRVFTLNGLLQKHMPEYCHSTAKLPKIFTSMIRDITCWHHK